MSSHNKKLARCSPVRDRTCGNRHTIRGKMTTQRTIASISIIILLLIMNGCVTIQCADTIRDDKDIMDKKEQDK